MEPGKCEAMLARIHFIEIAIAQVRFPRNLNQFKPDADHIAVVRALLRRGDWSRTALRGKDAPAAAPPEL